LHEYLRLVHFAVKHSEDGGDKGSTGNLDGQCHVDMICK